MGIGVVKREERRWRGRREYRSEQKKSIVYNNRIEDYNIIIV